MIGSSSGSAKAQIRTKRVRKQKADRQDAELILRCRKIAFRGFGYRVGRIAICGNCCGSDRMVQARTRIMKQLQAVALNEGLGCKKQLWRDAGQEQLEAFRLAPWASRRHDLLELMDRLTPTIADLIHAIEQEAEKCPAAPRLHTHPGVGALTALTFVLIIGV